MLWERSRIVALMALGLYFIAGGSSAANTPDDYSASHQKMVQVLKEIAARTADEHPYLGDAQARRFRGQLQALSADAPTGMEGNVAVHTDPAYWLPAEPLDNVARFMASLAVSGVPMLSTDLRTLPAAQRPIVQNWLRFYRENKELLLFGTQRFLSADPHYSLFSIHRGETALWSVFTESFPGVLQVPGEGVGHMWILNGSLQERVYSRLTGVEGERLALRVYDRALEEKSGAELPVEGGVVILDVEMEAGGALELLVKRK